MAQSPSVDISEHLEQLHVHGTGLVDAAEQAGVDAAVPTCPDWAVRDLLGHIGRVHRWAATFVDGRTEPPRGDHELATVPDADDELAGWVLEGLAALVAAIRNAPADRECWTFLPAPTPLAFWARRQAHETAIHHVDAASAAGIDVAIDTRLAVDGIDELLLGFFNRPRGRLLADPPVTLGVRAVDGRDGDEWSMRIDGNGRETNRGLARGECIVSGPAAALYRFLWNRSGDDALTVDGDRRVLDLWRQKARITWS